MYAIKVNNEIAGYSDSFVYIRLHTNGCYVLCDADEAEGICAKVAKDFTDAETGETVTQIADTVFRLTDDGLHGTEPKCEIETVNGARVIADKDSELKNAVSTGDLEAAYKEGVNSI